MQSEIRYPTIIQGGMGIAVSSWQLAQQVAIAGELGVISGTAIDSVVARRLQAGDLSGDIRRAMSHFPNQKTIAEVMDRFYVEGGRATDKPYLDVPKLSIKGNLVEYIKFFGITFHVLLDLFATWPFWRSLWISIIAHRISATNILSSKTWVSA